MRTTIELIGCHAEGEVGDVIVGGVEPPPGETVWEQSRFIATDDQLRQLVLNEPRGGVFRHVNLLVPPVHPDADAAWLQKASAYFSSVEHMLEFSRGVVDSRPLVLYLSLTALVLFATVKSIESRRWR